MTDPSVTKDQTTDASHETTDVPRETMREFESYTEYGKTDISRETVREFESFTEYAKTELDKMIDTASKSTTGSTASTVSSEIPVTVSDMKDASTKDELTVKGDRIDLTGHVVVNGLTDGEYIVHTCLTQQHSPTDWIIFTYVAVTNYGRVGYAQYSNVHTHNSNPVYAFIGNCVTSLYGPDGPLTLEISGDKTPLTKSFVKSLRKDMTLDEIRTALKIYVSQNAAVRKI